jgi:N-acetylglucosaminyl-diphospho-decaprenol L-rhamnosyltransferase
MLGVGAAVSSFTGLLLPGSRCDEGSHERDVSTVRRGVGVMKRIDLVVVTYNSAHVLGDFLDSVDSLDGVQGADVRTCVVDNASCDDTVAIARAHRRRTAIIETGANLGYAAAINHAVRGSAQNALLIVANPDIRFAPGFLSPVLATAAEPGVGVVAPVLFDERGIRLPSLRRDPTVRRAFSEALLGGERAGKLGLGELVLDPARYADPADVDWASGALLVITPACRRAVGAWDESFFLYSEETDYQLRARAAGFRVRFTPAAAAIHRGGAVHVDPHLWSRLTDNRVRLFRKYHGRAHTVAFWLAALCNELLRSARSRTHRSAARQLVRRFRSLIA